MTAAKLSHLIAACALTAAAPAVAQPVTQPASCDVTIARAPDDVRSAIESWVHHEPRCTTSIEVRAIATQDGIYLFAQTGAGRVYERVVPDAQTAGVLVASWAADEGAVLTPPTLSTPVPMAGAAPAMIEVRAPGDLPSSTASLQRAALPETPPAHRSRALTLGLVLMEGMDDVRSGGGLKGELDLLNRGPWSLAVEAAYVRSGAGGSGSWAPNFDLDDVEALARVARTIELRSVQLRLAAGLGVVRTGLAGVFYAANSSPMEVAGSMISPIADGSALLSIGIRNRWSITGGPAITVFEQQFHTNAWQGYPQHYTRVADLLFVAGVQYRL